MRSWLGDWTGGGLGPHKILVASTEWTVGKGVCEDRADVCVI